MEIRASTGSLNGEEGRGDGMKRDAWEQEFRAVWRREERFLRQYECPPKSPLDQKVSELAPEKLIETLRAAFEKAVAVVFDKGSGVVIRENRRAEQQRTYQINAYAAHLQETRRSLRAFSKAAGRAGQCPAGRRRWHWDGTAWDDAAGRAFGDSPAAQMRV